MNNKSQIYVEHFRGNEEFVKRVYDLINRSCADFTVLVTPFFSPDQIAITVSICGKQCRYEIYGGYEEAERCRIAFLPFNTTPNFAITLLKAEISTVHDTISHRDVLGAFMNLGLQRDKIGDIVINEKAVYLFVDSEIANYVICNLLRIKRRNVCFACSDDNVTPSTHMHYKQEVVSSLRLDALITSLIHVSRAQAQALIHSGQVKVNHIVLEQSAFLCNNNSAISIRGYGRYLFLECIKKTKKGHYVIQVGVYE